METHAEGFTKKEGVGKARESRLPYSNQVFSKTMSLCIAIVVQKIINAV